MIESFYTLPSSTLTTSQSGCSRANCCSSDEAELESQLDICSSLERVRSIGILFLITTGHSSTTLPLHAFLSSAEVQDFVSGTPILNVGVADWITSIFPLPIFAHAWNIFNSPLLAANEFRTAVMLPSDCKRWICTGSWEDLSARPIDIFIVRARRFHELQQNRVDKGSAHPLKHLVDNVECF